MSNIKRLIEESLNEDTPYEDVPSIYKLLNLPEPKEPKKKVEWCGLCKCKTLKEQASLNGYKFWSCVRPEHSKLVAKILGQRKDVNEIKKLQQEYDGMLNNEKL